MADSDLLNARSLSKLGAAVRAVRTRRGLSQAELAAAARVSRQWVVSLERGQTEGLEVGRLMRVLDSLDASLTIRVDEPAPTS